jgi:hypothetical protein
MSPQPLMTALRDSPERGAKKKKELSSFAGSNAKE